MRVDLCDGIKDNNILDTARFLCQHISAMLPMNRLISATFWAGAYLLTRSAAVLSGAQPSIQPSVSFDLVTNGFLQAGAIADAITLTSSDIFVSTSSRPNGTRAILRLSRLGTLVDTARLPPDTSTRDVLTGIGQGVVIDQAGAAFLLRLMPDRTRRVEKYAAGNLSLGTTLWSPVIGFNISDDLILALYEDGDVVPITRRQGAFQLASHILMPDTSTGIPAVRLVPLDPSTVAAVNYREPLIQILDLGTRATVSTLLDCPEVRAALDRIASVDAKRREPHPADARPLLFHDATSDGNGHLFLAVGPGSLSRGMEIIKLDKKGQYMGSMCLLPPAAARLMREGNPAGLVLQGRFSVAGATIATLSYSGIVSLFALD